MFAATLRQRCEKSGDDPFVLHGDRTLSWAETLRLVERTATLFHQLGVRPGDRVLLCCGNNPVFLCLWFALRWVGATCVPLHSRATPTHTMQVIADAGIEYAVGDGPGVERLRNAGWSSDDRLLDLADTTDLEERVRTLPPHPCHPSSATDECSMLYTSGTTGPPKGAVLSDQAFLAGGVNLADAIGIRADDRILVALPLFHTNPQVYAVMTAIATGCSIVLLERYEPAALLDQAVRYEATGFTYVGTVLSTLSRQAPEPVPPHKLRFCTGGGAPEPLWADVEDRLGVAVHELYGMTETGGWVTANHAGRRRRGSCGTPRPDMEVAVLDEYDERCPPGVTGQICVRPRRPSVLFDGYHGKPEVTLRAFRNLWFHTGDLGWLDEDGYLYFAGRADDLIRHRGENVRPADVESVLNTHPHIEEAAVVGLPDDEVGHEIRAVVVPRDGFDPCGLPEFLTDKLPKFAWPRFVGVTDSLPKTSTQKVQTARLRHRDEHDVDLRRPERRGDTR